jgi:hypothetical protein
MKRADTGIPLECLLKFGCNLLQEPVQSMDNLPIDPSVGDKRPRGDDHDEEVGNSIPPNLRSNTGNPMIQSMPQRQGMGIQPQQQQWQGGPGNQTMGNMNMTAANASLDALYVGELNWVRIFILLRQPLAHEPRSGQRMKICAASPLSLELNYS